MSDLEIAASAAKELPSWVQVIVSVIVLVLALSATAAGYLRKIFKAEAATSEHKDGPSPEHGVLVQIAHSLHNIDLALRVNGEEGRRTTDKAQQINDVLHSIRDRIDTISDRLIQ